MKPHLFPAPRRCSTRKTTLELAGADWMVLPQPCSRKLRERAVESACRLGQRLNQPIRVAAAAPEKGVVLLEVCIDAAQPAQGFELKLGGDRRSLTAGDEAGAFYGLLAFVQLVEQFGATPPVLTIQDSPDFPARGVMLDVSRCKVPTMATCKQLVDRLAGMRLNQLQLYIEHTFAFSAHETVWHDASPFTHEEILELDQYCADRFVELVPNFNSFGHFGRWLRHPEYRHLGEEPDRSGCGTLAPNNASLKLLDSLYDEYLPNFSSKLFNVGCDETWELGQGRSKRRAEKSSTTEVYLDFIKKIHKLCAKRGRRMQFWGDIILHQPDLIAELPPDVLALCWGYQATHPYAKQCPAFARAGIEYYVCPGTSSWNSITGRTDNCLGNLENAARNGMKNGATGYLITDWGDGGHHQVLPVSYTGFAAGAAYSWCLRANRQVDLGRAISHHFFRDPSGVLGDICLELGRTLNRFPGVSFSNRGVINEMLFRTEAYCRTNLKGVTATHFDKAEAWLGKLESKLPQARPACDDRDLVLAELRHTIAMSRYAIHRGRSMQSGDGSSDALRRELQSLVMSHEEQWLARNRRGGLHESSNRLRKTVVIP